MKNKDSLSFDAYLVCKDLSTSVGWVGKPNKNLNVGSRPNLHPLIQQLAINHETWFLQF